MYSKNLIGNTSKNIRQHLYDYPHTESVTPKSCDVCGRLLGYDTTLNENTWKPGYLRK